MTTLESLTDRNRAAVREIYDAAVRLDTSVLERYLADDVRLVEPAGHPVGRTLWEGRTAFMAGLLDVFTLLRVTALRVHEIVADGPHRVIGLLDIVTDDEHGAECTVPLAEVFRWEDGRITEIQPYYFDLVRVRELASRPSP
jgi:hypothetical protein